MEAEMLELAAEQVLDPVSEDAIEALLTPRTRNALRRRFPPGTGMFLLTDSGEVFFDPGRGMAPFALTQLDQRTARSVPRLMRAVDVQA